MQRLHKDENTQQQRLERQGKDRKILLTDKNNQKLYVNNWLYTKELEEKTKSQFVKMERQRKQGYRC